MNIPEDMPQKAKELAKSYFCDDHNNCAETVFRSIMTANGRDCPIEVLKMASPFGRGMGEAGCACGALVGGQMAIGVFFGRESTNGFPPALCAEAAKMLHKRFVKANGASCCRILHKGLPFGTDEQFNACCARAVEATEIAASLIKDILENHTPDMDLHDTLRAAKKKRTQQTAESGSDS